MLYKCLSTIAEATPPSHISPACPGMHCSTHKNAKLPINGSRRIFVVVGNRCVQSCWHASTYIDPVETAFKQLNSSTPAQRHY